MAGDGSIPAFDELPALSNGVRHAWDVWGPGDNLGTLSRLTPDVVAAAAACVRTGERVGLSLPLGLPDPPFFGRKRYRHVFHALGTAGMDDHLEDFYPQSSTQWDGLRHIASPDGWYGGWHGRAEEDLEPLGIHHWARGGIVGRGVLVDLAALASAAAPSYDPFSRVAFTPADIEAALAAQRTSLRPGDILCVRTGWADKYLSLPAAEREAVTYGMRGAASCASAGLASSEHTARFLWDAGVAALPCDNPAVEVVPLDPADGFLHARLIPALGLAIGEMFVYGELAAACAREGRYEFLFVSVPLNATGAVGSPGSAVAVL
jgi:kynurenine formamidase